MQTISLDIWSDVACPWCFVGKRRLERAVKALGDRMEARVAWHAFQLDPSAPKQYPPESGYIERLAAKYGRTVEQARDMVDTMAKTGESEGIDFRFDRVQGCNTFDAHRLLALAAERGVQGALKERLLLAYMTEGRLLSDVSTLASLASEVGLDADEVASVLASDQFAKEVQAERAGAARLGISGVPFFVIDGRFAVEGAQPTDLFVRVFEQVLQERPVDVDAATGAESCDVDGCSRA